ncbi:hypothetical protein FS837_011520 [Tulasnella sp. UAMH 9824]|nr:hypothetical protein FS837_011520 [Tulasnella sp. UAMH 9824]
MAEALGTLEPGLTEAAAPPAPATAPLAAGAAAVVGLTAATVAVVTAETLATAEMGLAKVETALVWAAALESHSKLHLIDNFMSMHRLPSSTTGSIDLPNNVCDALLCCNDA